MAQQEQDEEYFIPLEDQRVFGAGLKRKRVQFVPSAPLANASDTTTGTSQRSTTATVGSIYESIVLPGSKIPVAHHIKHDHSELSHGNSSEMAAEKKTDDLLCDICHLPLPSINTSEITATTTKPHEASLAHQACLAHSHPPSHLDRRHKGLQYLSSYGWDPDGRRGLGVDGEGRLFPVKSRVKNDTLGVGFRLPTEFGKTVREKKPKLEKLDAKRVRKRDDEQRKKAAGLQRMFYQSEELNRYLSAET